MSDIFAEDESPEVQWAREHECCCHLGSPPCFYCTTHCPECKEYVEDRPLYELKEFALTCSECKENYQSQMEYQTMTDDTKYENIIACVNKEVTTVMVSYGCVKPESDNQYMFKLSAQQASELNEGDAVLVGNSKVAYVCEIHDESRIDPDSLTSYHWIEAILNFDEFDKQVQLERANVAKFKETRRAKLRQAYLQENSLTDIQLITELPKEQSHTMSPTSSPDEDDLPF